MKIKELNELIEENTSSFLNNIARELEEPHNQWFDSFGFPLFGETSKDYHEQVYFQSYLESYTRKMINGILKGVLESEITDSFLWPEFDFSGIYNGYTNIEYENEFGFEFINLDRRIGYRYTSFKINEIENLLKKGNVDTIIEIVWQNQDDIVGYDYGDPRARTILLWDLFQELLFELSEEELKRTYCMFIENVTKAVEQANSMISLVTIPGFTSSYIFKTRSTTIFNLQENIRKLSSFYVKHIAYKTTEENSKQLIEKYKLNEYFLEKGLERAFVGNSNYAKSYLTSEYLLLHFKNNPMFDYTPIVSGYLKSVEQLLDTICVSFRNANNLYLNMKPFTLGNYKQFIDDHETILRSELLPAKDIIIACLESYRIESRNNLFHKDYFNNWTRVEQIRNNTIFLYVALLGSVDSKLLSGNPKVLGIINMDYDNMFSILDKQTEYYYTFILNGIEYTEMEKVHRETGLLYNGNGLICNKINFKKFSYDHYVNIELSRDCMPSEIWTSDVYGKKKKKIWPIKWNGYQN